MMRGTPVQSVLRQLGVASALTLAVIGVGGCDDRMADQPRYEALEPTAFYRDLQSSRHPVEGTIARGQLDQERYTLSYLETTNGLDEHGYPYDVTAETLEIGRLNFNIYCSVCHGLVGDGDGMIPSRGYTIPPSFHIDRLRESPPSYFVNVITNGFGRMPDYGEKIKPRDRWAIATYIEALQLSQNVDAGGLPPEDREQLDRVEEAEGR